MAHFLRVYKMLISPLFLKDVSLDRDKTIGQRLRIISKIFEKKKLVNKLQLLWTHYNQNTNVSFEEVLLLEFSVRNVRKI